MSTSAHLIDFLTRRQASTRTAALMRIGLPVVILSKYGSDFQLFRDLDPWHLAASVLLFGAASLMFFGVHSRISTALTGLSSMLMYYGFGVIDGHEAYTHHHTYLLAIAPCLLALTPCGRSFSWDRWRQVRKAERDGRPVPEERGAMWALSLMSVQLSAIYLWGTISKLSPDWFNGARFEQLMLYLYLPNLPDGLAFPVLMKLMGWASLILEPALAIGLYFRSARRVLFPIGLALHALMYWTLPVTAFSAAMMVCYLAWLDPDEVHSGIDRMLGR